MYKQRWLMSIILIALMVPVFAWASDAAAPIPTSTLIPESAPEATAAVAAEATAEPVAEYRTMSQSDAKALLYESPQTIVVDVRGLDEYIEEHIPGAINIPNEDISDTRPAVLDDLNATILVYCRTGVRSEAASNKLVEMGYTGIYDIGGISTWEYATVSGQYPYGDEQLISGDFVCKYCYDTDEPRVCAFCGEQQVCAYCGNCNSCRACAC